MTDAAQARMSRPKKLRRGWRRSLRTGALYRRRAGWIAIITVDPQGYRTTLRRVASNLEVALASTNEMIEQAKEST